MNFLSKWVCCVLICIALTGCWGGEPSVDTGQTNVVTPVGETTAQSAPKPAPDTIKALGILRPRQTLTLSFQSAGVIRTLMPQIGSAVRQGEQLAELDTTALTLTLQNAEAAVAIREAELNMVATNPQRSQPERVIAAAQLQQAQIARDQLLLQLANAVIDAPFDGVVSAIHAQPGEYANAGQPVIEVIDTSRWRVETQNVSELNISRIAIGQPVEVRVIVLPDQILTGKIITIDPVAVVQQGDTTYTLYIELEATDLPLLAGMNVAVAIVTALPG